MKYRQRKQPRLAASDVDRQPLSRRTTSGTSRRDYRRPGIVRHCRVAVRDNRDSHRWPGARKSDGSATRPLPDGGQRPRRNDANGQRKQSVEDERRTTRLGKHRLELPRERPTAVRLPTSRHNSECVDATWGPASRHPNAAHRATSQTISGRCANNPDPESSYVVTAIW